jgi:hypothetical protein
MVKKSDSVMLLHLVKTSVLAFHEIFGFNLMLN